MSTQPNAFSPESWEYARRHAGMFGNVPSSFTSVIRGLMNEHSAGLASTTGQSKYFLVRLLKSPSLSAPFYFLCATHNPDVLLQNTHTPPDALAKAFTPFELAYLLGLVYLVRRAQTLCDKEEWKYVAEPLARNVNTAIQIGRSIPAIGTGTALIEASAPLLGLCAFMKHDVKGFREYRRNAKKRNNAWDCDEEVERWGCNHVQIASVLVQTLGFGITRANALVMALSSKADVGSADEVSLARDFRMAQLWRESVMSTLNGPTIPIHAKYYPTKAAQQNVITTMRDLLEQSCTECWLFKNKEDLPEYQVPGGVGARKEGEKTAAPTDEAQPPAELDALEAELQPLAAEAPES
jgi:hypothetical protein